MLSLILALACETELPPEGSLDPEECRDGFDNDEDGLVDCHDLDCEALRDDCDEEGRPDPRDTAVEPDVDTDVDMDTDVDADTDFDSAVWVIGNRGETDIEFTGFYEVWVQRWDGFEFCTYTWDTLGLEPVECEGCEFAWSVGFSDGRSETLEDCEGVFGDLGQDYPLSDASLGFSTSFEYYGSVFEDVLVYHDDERWVPWAYVTYEDGVLSWDQPRGYYYY